MNTCMQEPPSVSLCVLTALWILVSFRMVTALLHSDSSYSVFFHWWRSPRHRNPPAYKHSFDCKSQREVPCYSCDTFIGTTPFVSKWVIQLRRVLSNSVVLGSWLDDPSCASSPQGNKNVLLLRLCITTELCTYHFQFALNTGHNLESNTKWKFLVHHTENDLKW